MSSSPANERAYVRFTAGNCMPNFKPNLNKACHLPSKRKLDWCSQKIKQSAVCHYRCQLIRWQIDWQLRLHGFNDTERTHRAIKLLIWVKFSFHPTLVYCFAMDVAISMYPVKTWVCTTTLKHTSSEYITITLSLVPKLKPGNEAKHLHLAHVQRTCHKIHMRIIWFPGARWGCYQLQCGLGQISTQHSFLESNC